MWSGVFNYIKNIWLYIHCFQIVHNKKKLILLSFSGFLMGNNNINVQCCLLQIILSHVSIEILFKKCFLVCCSIMHIGFMGIFNMQYNNTHNNNNNNCRHTHNTRSPDSTHCMIYCIFKENLSKNFFFTMQN